MYSLIVSINVDVTSRLLHGLYE